VSGLQRAVTRIRALGVPHKWVLTVLLVLQEQRKPSLTVGLVMDTYIRLWKRYGITHGLGAAEVADVVSSLDAMGGFLTLDQGRLTGRERKVRLSVRGAEVWDAVQIEGAMFKDVVQDEIGWRHAP
jgi:Cdc6-like AAA superfamily ATPase